MSDVLYTVSYLLLTFLWSRCCSLHFTDEKMEAAKTFLCPGPHSSQVTAQGLDPRTAWLLSSCCPPLLCHTDYFTTPNCWMRKCNNREGSLGESWGWWFDLLRNIKESYMSAFGRRCSCCLHFCFWWVVSVWYWKVNRKLKNKLLCVPGQKSGEKINETFRFVPVFRNALEGFA